MPAVKRIAAAFALVSGLAAAPALAQDYGPYGYGGAPGFDWDGFYAGVYGGGVPFGTSPSWTGGIFTGVNVALDGAVFGMEAQLGADFDPSLSLDALVLGRGGVAMGDMLLYGTAGTGLVKGDFGYAFGGGAEYAVTNTFSVRAEALGTGAWGGGPANARLALGLAFHL